MSQASLYPKLNYPPNAATLLSLAVRESRRLIAKQLLAMLQARGVARGDEKFGVTAWPPCGRFKP